VKTTIFKLENPEYADVGENSKLFGVYGISFDLPTLSAYAICHTNIDLPSFSADNEGSGLPPYRIEGNRVVLEPTRSPVFGKLEGSLFVYHTGIRNYELLFPHVTDDGLRKRLGQFAEEADKAFESGSWMSYTMMVGAALEGVLYSLFGNLKFERLIAKAAEDGVIIDQERDLLNKVREQRNLIHASRYAKSFVDRETAMDLSVVYDRLLKRRY